MQKIPITKIAPLFLAAVLMPSASIAIEDCGITRNDCEIKELKLQNQAQQQEIKDLRQQNKTLQGHMKELQAALSLVQEKMAALTVSSDGNVGIGTTRPKGKLDVVGLAIAGDVHGNRAVVGSDTSGGYVSYQNDSGKSGFIKFDDNDDLYFANVYGNFVLVGGNFGLGTTSPSSKLHVQGGSIGSRSNGLTIQGAGTSAKCTLYMGHDGAGCTDGGSRLYTGRALALCVICD
jgi:FtsZ-binding cell division protein ZapB